MNSWSSRRKFFIFFLVLIVLGVVLGLPLYFFFHRAPSCSNGKMDGDETGIDCGGSCTTICTTDSLPLIMHGDPRVVPVASSTYALAVSIQNPNVSGRVDHAAYTVKFFDATSGEPLKTIDGSTYVPPAATFALFLGPYDFGDAVPVRAVLSWSTLTWVKDINRMPVIEVHDPLLSDTESKPHLVATAVNPGSSAVSNIEFVALIKDSGGTIIAASKTVIHSLPPEGSAPLIFTWPKPFVATPTAVEVVPRVVPDSSYFK
jgi:hypothetical protein